MADTIRKKIWDDIETTLKGISTIKAVEMHKASAIDIDKVALPSAFVFLDSDSGEEGNRYENWTLGIVIEVWAKNGDLEDMIGKVHAAMYEDRTCGGNATWTERTGSQIFQDIYPDRSLGAVFINFDVTYRHIVGDPYTA